MANRLPEEKQRMVLKLMVEGNSLRSITRLTGVHKKTVTRLLVKFGEGCRLFLHRELRDLKVRHVQCDEIWTFVRKKQRRLSDEEKSDPTVGDQFLFIALDADTKLVCTYALGKRDMETTERFIEDLARRVILPDYAHDLDKPQISTDGWPAYPDAIASSFGQRARYGQLIKHYGHQEQEGRYGPPAVVTAERVGITAIRDLFTICTSHIERHNLTIRTFMKRFTRLALGFSKKLDNLKAAVALQMAYYNYCWRPREKGKSGRLRLTPAMEAGLVGSLWKMDDLYDEVMPLTK